MAAKKARSSSDKQQKKTLRELKTKLERAEAKAARWKERAKLAQAEVGTLKARAAKLDRKAAKLDRKLAKARDAARHPAPEPEAELGTPVALTDVSAPTDEQSQSTPDASWTVAQLRAEARSRGLTGLSNKSKAELLAALT